MGRLTRDPELRYTPSGTPVASFTLAVDRDFKAEGGEKQTDFIDIVAWRHTGEFVSKYFTKGSMALVSGRLQIKEWQDKEGNKRRGAEIVADNVYFGEAKRDGARPAGAGVDVHNDDFDNAPRSGEGDFKGSAFSELDNADGDLPF